MVRKQNQGGFSVVEGLLLVIAVTLIGFVGYYVWHSQNQSKKTLSQSAETSQNAAATSPVAGLSTYKSNIGGFSLKYPSSWLISGTVSMSQPLVTKLTGDETQIRIQQKPDSVRTENFGGDFEVTNTAPGDTPYPFYPLGKIVKTFSNGISVWVANYNQTGADGSTITQSCPSFQIASNGAYGFKLKNGMWLAYSGSFCWGQGFSTSLSYNDQLKSPEVAQMYNILESIH